MKKNLLYLSNLIKNKLVNYLQIKYNKYDFERL